MTVLEGLRNEASTMLITDQQIREMKEKRKAMEKQFELTKQQAKAAIQSQAQQDARELMKTLHPEMTETESDKIYKTGVGTKQYEQGVAIREGRPTSIVQQSHHVSGKVGKEYGGYDLPKVNDDLRQNADSRARMVKSVEGWGADAKEKQSVLDAITDMNNEYDDQKAIDRANKALSDIAGLGKDEKEIAFLIKKSKPILTAYLEYITERNSLSRIKRQLESGSGIVRQPVITEQPTTDETPTGETGTKEDDKIIDEVLQYFIPQE